MSVRYPNDPVVRRRMVRLQYLGIALIAPMAATVELRAHFNGSALQTMRPYLVRRGTMDASIPAHSW
jgi:hypothetical protein